jgi:sulfide:quinone oxidoreductase
VTPGSPDRPRIAVAGGGPAALEAILTIAERLPAAARRLSLVAPNRTLDYRPLSAVGEFATHPSHRLALADVASSTDAVLIRDRAVMVDERERRLLTRDGEWVPFEHLLLAVGAQQLPVPHGWLRWPPEGDPGLLYRLLQRLGGGRLRQLAVVVPANAGWPLAGHELAAILAVAARAAAVEARILLLVEDRAALDMLGKAAAEIVGSELERVGVELVSGVEVRPVEPEDSAGGSDRLTAVMRRLRRPTQPAGASERRIEVEVGGERMDLDLAISLPNVRGPGIAGIATDGRGYLAVDGYCRSTGGERTWAAGDCTALPLKHSTLAVAQASVAADNLASTTGARLEPRAFAPTLTGVLVAGAAERWWQENTNLPAGLEPATHCLWWPPGRVLGGRLAHYVARRDPAARPLLLSHPQGTAVRVRLPAAASGTASAQCDARQVGSVSHDESLLRADVLHRRLNALQRVERDAESWLHRLDEELDQEGARSREMLADLNAAGYVVKDRSPVAETRRRARD